MQPVAQVPPAHAYPGMHGMGAGAVHMPVPLQVDMAMLDLASAEQVAGAQVSPPWVWQALPLTAQKAVLPHIWSEQAVAQQTLGPVGPVAMQWPVPAALQSVSALQAIPRPTGGLHRPPMQV